MRIRERRVGEKRIERVEKEETVCVKWKDKMRQRRGRGVCQNCGKCSSGEEDYQSWPSAEGADVGLIDWQAKAPRCRPSGCHFNLKHDDEVPGD